MSHELLLHAREIIIPASFSIPFLLAFSREVRKQIGERDNWECQEDDCGKRFQDGYMVHAAHLPEVHSKSHPDYDKPESGRILCIEHHIEEHEQGTSLGFPGDNRAVALLKTLSHLTFDAEKKASRRK